MSSPKPTERSPGNGNVPARSVSADDRDAAASLKREQRAVEQPLGRQPSTRWRPSAPSAFTMKICEGVENP